MKLDLNLRVDIIKCFFAIIFVITTTDICCQEHFFPLQCQGPIPEEYIKTSKAKSRDNISKEAKEVKRSSELYQRAYFIRVSDFWINELLLSGKVLFQDPVTKYLTNILNNILSNDIPLRNRIHLFVLRSPEPNAFATNGGYVFVTTGLISEVENEAQLAYILSHEVTHIEKRHVINSFLENVKIFSSESSDDEKLKSASNYSKELEIESDLAGLRRLLDTDYDIREAIHSMDILQFSHLPFNNISFDYSIFENARMKIPHDLKLQNIQEIDWDSDNRPDSLSTHPNIKKRRILIAEELKNLEPSLPKGLKFIQSEESFRQIQYLARLETIRLLLTNRDYSEAIYESSSLLNEYEEKQVFLNFIAKGLYGIAKYKCAERYSEIIPNSAYFEGNILESHHFFNGLNAEQSLFLACRFLYTQSLLLNNPFINILRDDLFKDLIFSFEVSLDNMVFKTQYYDNFLSEYNGIIGIRDSSINEYKDSIPKPEKDSRIENGSDLMKNYKLRLNTIFHYGFFSDLINDTDFVHYYSTIANAEHSVIKRKDLKIPSTEKRKRNKVYRDEILDQDKKNVKSGVIFSDPYHYSFNEMEPMSFLTTEPKTINFANNIQRVSNLAGIKGQVLSSKNLLTEDVHKVNDISLLNYWIKERSDHNTLNIIPLESEYVGELIQRYGTKYVSFPLMSSYRPFKLKIFKILLSGVFLVVYPGMYFAIQSIIDQEWELEIENSLFDLETGELLYRFECNFKHGIDNNFIGSLFYNEFMLWQ